MKKLLTSFALLALAGAAQAQLAYSGGTPVTFSGYTDSDITGTGPVSAGIDDALISATTGGTLTVTFLGKEAANHNTYTFSLSNTIDNTGAVGTTLSALVSAGLLNFTFTDLTAGDSVNNGGSVGYASYALLGAFNPSTSAFVANTAGGAYTYVLGFNDGATVDSDYDDLVVGLKLTPAVPEPGTYALLLAGLGAVGFMVRRRQARQA